MNINEQLLARNLLTCYFRCGSIYITLQEQISCFNDSMVTLVGRQS